MQPVHAQLIGGLHQSLRDQADSGHARKMRAYLKSEMPLLGIRTGPLRQTCRPFTSESPLAEFEEWRECILRLWREAEFREERHAAIEIARSRRYRHFQVMYALAVYEEMIVSGA